jgi:hypothetical protein
MQAEGSPLGETAEEAAHEAMERTQGWATAIQLERESTSFLLLVFALSYNQEDVLRS